ncbi:MAG: hypothetical protein HY752_01880 [Nitrospirae bacterium]|nr:hypothetical protein [Nitrospirota bacterium]
MRNKILITRWWFHIIFYFLLFTSYFLLSSCGYHLIGSEAIPFNSVTIKSVKNNTYEPRLEEKLRNALSKEFITQGIKVMTDGGDVEIEAVVTRFELSSIGAVGGMVREQVITMFVDIKFVDKGKVTNFTSVESPMRITFQSTGSVSEAVVQKEKAIDKACSEIAKEIIGRITLMYVQ